MSKPIETNEATVLRAIHTFTRDTSLIWSSLTDIGIFMGQSGGFSGDESVGATLSQLNARGLVSVQSDGQGGLYALSLDGREALRAYEGKQALSL